MTTEATGQQKRGRKGQGKTLPGLYKRGNVWWIRYTGPDCRQRFETSRSTSRKGADALLILRKKQVMEGINPVAEHQLKSYLFTELADQYDAWAIRQRAYHTSKKYFIIHLRAHFGACAVKNLTVQMVEEYQSAMLHNGKAKATVNRHVACLKHMLTKAVEWEMVHEGVLQKIRKVKMISEQNQRLRFLSEEECQAVVNACSQHLKPIVITALHTGMRKEEILSSTVVFWVARGNRHLAITIDCFDVTQSFQQLGEDLASPVPAEGSAHAHVDERPSIDRIDPGRETPRRVVSRQPSEIMGGWRDRGIEKIQTGWKGCEYEVLVHQGLYRARR